MLGAELGAAVGGFRSSTKKSIDQSAATVAESPRQLMLRSQIIDNRARTSQIAQLQAMLQLSGSTGFHSQKSKIQQDAPQDGLGLRNQESSIGNWQILEVSDYLKRHQLKQKSKNVVGENTVIQLTDGSIIRISPNDYWRHECNAHEDEYFDSSHSINGDQTLTHFWTKAGYSLFRASYN